MISNVIKNSIDAYRDTHSDGNIDIIVAKNNNRCIITITDYAGGIAPEIAETLFKKMKTTKKEEGTGFGLYYAYQIIAGEFKGEMTFKTAQGKGTTFTISIPLKGGI